MVDLPEPGEWRSVDEAPIWKWLLGWTNHGYRFVMLMTKEHPEGKHPGPARPGWCTHSSYGYHLFFDAPGMGEPRDLVILKWTVFSTPPPEGQNEPGVPVHQADAKKDLF